MFQQNFYFLLVKLAELAGLASKSPDFPSFFRISCRPSCRPSSRPFGRHDGQVASKKSGLATPSTSRHGSKNILPQNHDSPPNPEIAANHSDHSETVSSTSLPLSPARTRSLTTPSQPARQCGHSPSRSSVGSRHVCSETDKITTKKQKSRSFLASVSILHRKTSIHGAEGPDRSVADRTVGATGFFPCDDTGSESVNRRRLRCAWAEQGMSRGSPGDSRSILSPSAGLRHRPSNSPVASFLDETRA